MNKSQAVLKGEALANQLLEKLASAGDVSSADGVAPGSTPNKVIVDNAAIVAEDDLRDQLQPGMGGSVNEIFDAVVADALAQGAVADETGVGVAANEGGAESGVPNQVDTYESDEHEKAAAVASLVSEGMDFDQAVNMVKQASDQLDAEEAEMEKVATINDLVEQGYSFEDAVNAVEHGDAEMIKLATLASLVEQGVDYDQAVDMVKEAAAGAALRSAYSAVRGAARSAGSRVSGAASQVTGKARQAGSYAKLGFRTSRGSAVAGPNAGALNSAAHATGKTAGKAVDLAKRRPYVTAGVGAGVGAVAAGGTYAATREKRAAFDGLVQMGYDPMTAANLVNKKALELYGE